MVGRYSSGAFSRNMKRRTFLKAAGVSSLALGGACAWRARHEGVFSVGEGPAFEPWRDWHNDVGSLALVRAAILAANPHNTQPWLFKVENTQIDVYADTARNLGTFDPYLREMHIGLGCAIENMVLAASTLGLQAKVTVVEGSLDLPRQSLRPSRIASIELSPGTPRQDELYSAIPHRHTNRAAYSPNRVVPGELLRSLQLVVEEGPTLKLFLFTAESERRILGNLMIAATASIIADKTMVDDSQRWFRSRWADLQKFRDGPTLDTAGLSPLMVAIAKIAPEPSPEANHRYWLAATRDVQVPSAPVLGLIAVGSLYDRAQAIHAGRTWQRMHLFATTRGLAMQPINQPVELVDRERQLASKPVVARALEGIVGDPKWKPTFAFRLGFPTREVPPSPRRPVGDVVIKT
jgi:nitroreductase